MEPSIKAVEGCDSECYQRHHLCAVREVKRLRKMVDRMIESPEHRLRYEDLESLYNSQCQLTDEWSSKARLADAKLNNFAEMVPAAWLVKANKQIAELNRELFKVTPNV